MWGGGRPKCYERGKGGSNLVYAFVFGGKSLGWVLCLIFLGVFLDVGV